ncbi:MAG: hypothetical protein JWO62_2481 [Acidimicrobiaceae bacterium]|jgi:hypothetical protein|nr:hypothetical protein [Acidimicrobiaceae bacterium]
MRRSLLVSSVVVATALSATMGTGVGLGSAATVANHQAKAGHDGERGNSVVLRSSLAPSVPSDPAIFAVKPGGAPWVLDAGHVRLGRGGELEVEVAGLVLATTGANPVPDLAASLYCNGALAATTAPVPFSATGNAHIHASVSLAAFCAAPAVLLNPATGSSPSAVVTGTYIAFDGTA